MIRVLTAWIPVFVSFQKATFNAESKSHAASGAWSMMVSVIKKNFRGVLHKSIAATSIERSIFRKLEERMDVTKNNL